MIPFSSHNIYKVISTNYLLMIGSSTNKRGSHPERGEPGIQLKGESGSLRNGASITGSSVVGKTIMNEAGSCEKGGVRIGVGGDNSLRKRCGDQILKCTKRE